MAEYMENLPRKERDDCDKWVEFVHEGKKYNVKSKRIPALLAQLNHIKVEERHEK